MSISQRWVLVSLLLGGASCLTLSCSDSDAPPQEPVAPAPEATPYPEDPALAQGDKKDAAPAKMDDSSAPPPAEPMKGDGSADTAPPAPEAAPSVADSQVEGQLTDNTPAYNPTPSEIPPEEKPSHGHHKGKHKASSAAKVTRYVSATMLNVRSKPSLKGAVVKHLKSGAEVHVEIHGKWGKIKNGQWVRVKYLSETPPAN